MHPRARLHNACGVTTVRQTEETGGKTNQGGRGGARLGDWSGHGDDTTKYCILITSLPGYTGKVDEMVGGDKCHFNGEPIGVNWNCLWDG